MLTIFSTCKPFITDTARKAQWNAITSWTLLKPSPQVILFGNEVFETGTEGLAAILECEYMDVVERNELGTPLVDSLFIAGQTYAENNIVAYVNADIILFQDFMDALVRVKAELDQFLMTGSRFNVVLDRYISFDPGGLWEAALWEDVKERGKLHPPSGVDYFVFRRGLYQAKNLEPFALGRYKHDSWLVWKALEQSIPVVDTTQVVTAIHSDHIRFPGRSKKEKKPAPPEVIENRKLSKSRPVLVLPDGTKERAGQLIHATWELTPTELRRKQGKWKVRR